MGEKLKAFPLSWATRMSPLASFIQHGVGSPSYSNQTRNKNTNWKERNKSVTVYRWHFLYTEKILHTTKKLLKVTSKLSEAAGYRIYTQKSVACLCTNDGLSERESKKTITFKTASKRINYPGVNLTKEVKDLNSENYNTLMKEIEDDTNRWKYILCSWIGKKIMMF